MRSAFVLPLNFHALAMTVVRHGHRAFAWCLKSLSMLTSGLGAMGATSGMATIAGAAATL